MGPFADQDERFWTFEQKYKAGRYKITSTKNERLD